MTHYQKLTTLLIRVFCLIGFLFGLMGLAFAFASRLTQETYSVQAAESFYASIFYLAFSLILFALSKPIAKLLCKGIDSDAK